MNHIALRILFLEDDQEDFEIITETLEEAGLSFISKRVQSKPEFLQALKSFHPDIILSDHSLPKFDSIEALEIAKAADRLVPFVLVTGAMSDEFAVRALKLGAEDYVLKSNLAKLPSVIENTFKQKVAEREKIKAATELSRRNDELSKINKELDTFVYSVSHNLRAPLMSVLGLLNIAKREGNIDVIKTYHDMMEGSINKLDETLREILEYSRNARQELVIEQIDLKEILEDNFQKMQYMPGVEKIERIIEINDYNFFYSDRYRLSVIFNNLISNSIKYADKSKREQFISISAEVGADTIWIKFQDNGIGIEEQLIPKVFDMFFRATQSKEGAGLGLYIVKEAVEMLNGKITVHSEKGVGTMFQLELPNHTAPRDFKNKLNVDRNVNALGNHN